MVDVRTDVAGVPSARDSPDGRHTGKTERSTRWYAAVPSADPAAHAKFLAKLPVNRWVEAKPPKSTGGRTWGSAVFDTDRGIAMKWGGGHRGYQGTDMAYGLKTQPCRNTAQHSP